MTIPFEHPISFVIPFLANDLLDRLRDGYAELYRSLPEPSEEVAAVLLLVEKEIQKRGKLATKRLS